MIHELQQALWVDSQKNVKFAKAAPEAAGDVWNFCRVHKTLGATPAMAAGLVDKVLKMADVVSMIDARETPALRGPYMQLRIITDGTGQNRIRGPSGHVYHRGA